MGRLVGVALMLLCVLFIAAPTAVVFAAEAPIYLWGYGGSCFNSWCEMGWHSSPAVATDPVSGDVLIVSAALDVYALNGSGATVWHQKSPSSGGRVWPSIVIADLNKDKLLEVVVASSGGWVAVYNLTDGGIFYPNYPTQPGGVQDEWRALTVADINQDGALEIMLGRAYPGNTNLYALTYYGTMLSGFPVGSNQNLGYTWGIYNQNLGIDDLNGDGYYEIIAPSDVFYVCVYNYDGSPYPANTTVFGSDRPYWGLVGFYYNETFELLGYGPCSSNTTATLSTIRTDFANGPTAIGDLDGDGKNEYVFVGDTYYCDPEETPDFNGMHIVFADRTRYFNTAKGFNWNVLPTKPTGAPLTLGNYSFIEDCQNYPVVADLDSDGNMEIIYPAWDGKMHAFWLDKTEHGNWPFNLLKLTTQAEVVYGTEPIIVDIENDGQAEVIFGSWTNTGSNDWGYLVVVNSNGDLLSSTEFPMPKSCVFDSSSCDTWNGVMAAPTIANIDDDPNYEIVMLSSLSGVLAYRLPNSTNAKILWGTGRGNIQRTSSTTIPNVGGGSPPPPNGGSSNKANSKQSLLLKTLSLFV